MPKLKPCFRTGDEFFSERLARLRKEAGFSQRALAAKVGVSHRVIAYYEGESKYTPAHLLPRLSRALGVSITELLGLRKTKTEKRKGGSPLRERIEHLEKLPPAKRKQIVQFLDTFIEREKLLKEK